MLMPENLNIHKKVSYRKQIARVSIRGRPCKIFLSSSLINTQNLAVVSHSLRADVRGRNYLGDAGTPSQH